MEKIGTKRIAELTGLTVQMVRLKLARDGWPGRIGERGIGAPGSGYEFNANDPKLKKWIERNTIADGEPVRRGRKPKTAYKLQEQFQPRPKTILHDLRAFTSDLKAMCSAYARRIGHIHKHIGHDQRLLVAKALNPLSKMRMVIAHDFSDSELETVGLKRG